MSAGRLRNDDEFLRLRLVTSSTTMRFQELLAQRRGDAEKKSPSVTGIESPSG